MGFIDEALTTGCEVLKLPNDQLIDLIAKGVSGVGYKVAQCCVLYAKGYHCGVIPLDSGMRDKLSLCIGLAVPKTPVGHEFMRKKLERMVAEIDCYEIAVKTGYQQLKLPQDRPLTWWTHLVLIYYKRLYCNHPKPPCPLRVGN
jgi:endonuclease III